jgi:hypothetical protein
MKLISASLRVLLVIRFFRRGGILVIGIEISFDLALSSRNPGVAHHKLEKVIIWNGSTHNFIVF